jgi:hypothetical protein
MQTSVHAISGLAKITIVVVDEFDRPIEGANVGIGFQYDKSWATDVRGARGLTDVNGKFSASNTGNVYIGYGARKDGYYESSNRYQFEESSLAVWKPWNPELKVILRKIENPVPMYARDLRRLLKALVIPVADKEVGFDLIEFDWVVPYGRGFVSDFIFYLTMIDNSLEDYEYNLKIKFSNEFDGIIAFDEEVLHGSLLKLPRMAPVDGYKKEISSFTSGLKRGAKNSSNNNRHYIFRIRSEQEGEKLKRAMYGKIISDIDVLSVRGSKLPAIFFKYYLNPDYTRNLEFDQKRNLFGNLPERERVGIQ